jgi:MarR family transcriptional regulator, negative regulator of the multidrug operon emrRAB
MSDSFQPFESAVHQVARRIKGTPTQEVLLTKLLHHVDTRLTDYHDGILKQSGLTHTVWTALIMLYASENGGLKPSELSVFMDSSRTNATRLADELVAKGWVERCPCADDRRQIYLQLTKKGLTFVESQYPALRERHSRLWAAFSKTEKQTMEALLRKLLKELGG